MSNKISEKLDACQRKLRDDCIKIVKDGLKTSLDVAAALMQLRDDKLYIETHGTFEDFCKEVFQIGRAHAYRLIGAAEIRASLPGRLSDKVTNESQLRALAEVPQENRVEVIKEAQASGPLTAESIKAASSKVLSPIGDTKQHGKTEESENQSDEKQVLDRTGYPVPDRIQERWETAESTVSAHLASLSKVRSEMATLMETAAKVNGDGPTMWAAVNLSNVHVSVSQAYRELKLAKPFAVCPVCQGRVFKTCTFCRGLGYVSEFVYKGPGVSEDLRKARAAMCKK